MGNKMSKLLYDPMLTAMSKKLEPRFVALILLPAVQSFCLLLINRKHKVCVC